MEIKKQASRGRQVGQFDPNSRISRLCALEVGDCETISRRIALTEATSALKLELKVQLSGTMRAAVARAKSRTEFEFTVEQGEFQTSSDNVVICSTATRTA